MKIKSNDENLEITIMEILKLKPDPLLVEITFYLFINLFIMSGFSFTNIHDSQDSRGRGRLPLYFLSTTSTRTTHT